MRSRHTSPVFASAATLAVAAMAAACIGSATPVHAAMIASDNAANYTSFGTTPSPTNGGTGFGAWNIQLTNDNSPPYAGSFLGGSGAYWGLYANTGSSTATPRVDAYRPFSGNLSANQAFSVELQSSSVGSDPAGGLPQFGFSLDNGAPSLSASSAAVTVGNGTQTSATTYTDANAVFAVSFNELGNNSSSGNLTSYNGQSGSSLSSGSYALETNIMADGTTTSTITGITDAQLSSGITANFALGAGNSYTLTLDSVGATPAVLATYTGTLNSSDVINGVDVFDQNTYKNGLFNNLAITATPEPASIALLAVAAGGLLLTRRKKLL